jgi:hypothetical protein
MSPPAAKDALTRVKGAPITTSSVTHDERKTKMTQILGIVLAVAPVAGVAYGSVRWGREQRPGFADDRPERDGVRWTIR